MWVIILELNYKKLGLRLKNARMKQNLTQQQLAERCNLSNVYISGIECGSAKTSLETLVKLCSVLKVTPDFVLMDIIFTPKECLYKELAELIGDCTDKNLVTIIALAKTIIEVQKD